MNYRRRRKKIATVLDRMREPHTLYLSNIAQRRRRIASFRSFGVGVGAILHGREVILHPPRGQR